MNLISLEMLLLVYPSLSILNFGALSHSFVACQTRTYVAIHFIILASLGVSDAHEYPA